MQKQLSTCVSVPQTEQVHSYLFSMFSSFLCTFASVLRCTTWVLILLVLVCLSADWAGALVLLFSFLPFSIYFWPPFFAVVWWAFCLLGVLLFRCLFPGGVLGPVSFGLLFASTCSVCPCVSGVFLCAFLQCSCGVAGSCWPGFVPPVLPAPRLVWCVSCWSLLRVTQ